MSEYYDEVTGSVNQGEENKLVRKALTSLPEPYLSGLKLNADIEINGLVLNTIDANNVVWVVSDIDGWWNLPQSEIPDLPRGWGDGSYDAIGRFSTRILTLNGSFLTQDPDQAPVARAELLNAVNLVKTGGWLIVDENPKKAAYVRLSGAPQITSVRARGRHDFSIGLVANDPIKYEYVEGNSDGYDSVTLTAGGGGNAIANVVNSGDVAVPIIIELSKNFTIPNANTPPVITNTENDQAITIIEGTAAENRLEIDTYNREILDVEYNYSTISGAVGDGTNVVYTTTSTHGLTAGSTVSVSGITPSSLNIDDAEVLAANSLTFTVASTVTASYTSGGEAAQYLSAENGRAKASVLIDWIYLEPGTNGITLANFASGATCTIYYRSGWLS